jgi:UDP-N-acetylglucosamine pyrophosphorylase
LKKENCRQYLNILKKLENNEDQAKDLIKKDKIINKEELIEKISTKTRLIPYFYFFLTFLFISFLFSILIYLSSTKNIIIMDPFYLFFGSLSSVGLTITSLIGLVFWRK